MEVGRGARKKVASEGIRKEDVVTFFEDTPQRMKTIIYIYIYIYICMH